jgi:lysophospholipase L1-like esterase
VKSTFVLSITLFAVLPLSAQTAQTAAPASTATEPCPPPKQVERMQARLQDWAQLDRYRTANAELQPPAPGVNRVVFYGDSITDFWNRRVDFFPGKPYIDRGISGQTTPQMLVRFQQDVVHLHPAVVVILAGTNDIAGNTGPSTPEMIEDNFKSMTAIAKQNGIKVVISSITPAFAYPWKPGAKPADEIRALNEWLKDFCQRDGDVYLDYYDSMADAEGGMKPGLSSDGVHPTAKGYSIMGPLADKAIAEALHQ